MLLNKMKKLVILTILFQIFLIHAKDSDTRIGFGYLGIGYSSDATKNDGYINGRLFNFMHQTEIGLGISVSPLNFYMHFNNKDNDKVTFLNVSLFYNFFKKDMEQIILGPFASVHTLSTNPTEFIEFRSGLVFSLRNFFIPYQEDSIFNSDLLNIECGYKYNKNDKNGFYIHIGIDLVIAIRLFYWF